VDRGQLADFLRRRRERLTPADVGLPAGVRRRTPGLRREEVVQLAGMSTDYLARLEQSRGPQPSTQVLAALARALRLTDDERDHLYYLAGRTPPAFHRPNAHISPGLLHVLDHLTDSAAFVLSDLGETLVQNPVAIALQGDESHPEGLDRYAIWRWFTNPATRAMSPEEDWPTHSRTYVADLRATAAHDLDALGMGAMVAVRGIGDVTTRVTDPGRDDTGKLADQLLDAPEAASGEDSAL
jgi:transcriptional regulator with XRE-family HTH domain